MAPALERTGFCSFPFPGKGLMGQGWEADRERRAAFANSPAETWGLLEKLGRPAVVK